MILGFSSGFEVATLDTLTAAGVTSSQRTTGCNLAFQITVTGIGTNVVIRLEGSLDDTNYFNLDQNELDTTITSNKTVGFCLNGCPVKFVRVRLVSFSGGTPSIASLVGSM
tara:strand:+ start:536 stop:868 length:333 start_codon:yes stop_codon:yes gene_type:complete